MGSVLAPEARTAAPSPFPIAVVSVPGRGRGVIATRPIAKGERIERAPVIVLEPAELEPAELEPAELEAVRATRLARYYFEWGEHEDMGAIVLGYGSLYNHSYEPCAEFEFRESELAIDCVALRNIRAGEEITINYNNTGDNAHHPIRFD